MDSGEKELFESDLAKTLDVLTELMRRARRLGFKASRSYISDAYDFVEEAIKQLDIKDP